MNGITSREETVIRGMPHGSSLYKNDRCTCLSLFADNTKMLSEITEVSDMKTLQDNLHGIIVTNLAPTVPPRVMYSTICGYMMEHHPDIFI